jgi:TonB family protein
MYAKFRVIICLGALCCQSYAQLNTPICANVSSSKPISTVFISTSRPTYPQDAFNAKREGTVGFKFDINTDGKLRDICIYSSSGDQQIDQAALAWLEAAKAELPINFESSKDHNQRFQDSLTFSWKAEDRYRALFGDAQTLDNTKKFKAISRPTPPYPREALILGKEGLVVVQAIIGKYGVPTVVRISKSSGVASLDGVALATVSLYRFEASQTPYSIEQEFNFTLK